MQRCRLHTPRDAAQILGVSYAAVKQWIYRGKIKSVQTQGGHHRIPETEIDRLLPRRVRENSLEKGCEGLQRISGRNQLVGRILDIKVSGLVAQVVISVGSQRITSIVTADAVREMRLQKGQVAVALIKSTEVMIAFP